MIALLARLPEQIVDQHLGVNFFLDVERRRVDDEVAPVLLVLPAPDELGIEVGVARILYRLGLFLLFLKNGLVLGGRDVLPLGFVVLERFDGFESGRFLGHELCSLGCDAAVAGNFFAEFFAFFGLHPLPR